MGTYLVTTTVEYTYEVEADSREEAEQEGWNYDDYRFTGQVYSIDVEDITQEDDE
jgi:hypothetical protein